MNTHAQKVLNTLQNTHATTPTPSRDSVQTVWWITWYMGAKMQNPIA